MRPVAEGLVERRHPELMYVDRRCCRILGVSTLEQLFHMWVDSGMLIRLDIFHWIHRFDAAVWTDHHPKYALFKSALSAAVFSYNREDMALFLQAVREGHAHRYNSLSDGQLIDTYVTKRDLSHYVRRITVGPQETFVRVQSAIDILNGPAGMDENQVHLFKSAATIDHVWENHHTIHYKKNMWAVMVCVCHITQQTGEATAWRAFTPSCPTWYLGPTVLLSHFKYIYWLVSHGGMLTGSLQVS